MKVIVSPSLMEELKRRGMWHEDFYAVQAVVPRCPLGATTHNVMMTNRSKCPGCGRQVPEECDWCSDNIKRPKMKRINVRDQWKPCKILGTLPWDEKETQRQFSWQQTVNGCPTQQIIKLQVHRMIIGDIDETAYLNGGHVIEVLRKLPEFAEKTDER